MRENTPSFLSLSIHASFNVGRIITVDKTVRRVTNPEQQEAETYAYWHSLTIGERLSAVWDASEAAYAFAAAFKGVPVDDAQGSERVIKRLQRSRG